MHPETLIIKTVLFIRTTSPRVVRLVTNLGWRKGSAAAVIVILGVVVGVVMIGGPGSLTVPAKTVHSVELKTVAELSSETTPLSVVGIVSSESEATVRAEKSGQVVGVYKVLGQSITAGTIAAELENASERAMVLQAEGSVDAAQANLAKTTGGARSEQRAILQANLDNATVALASARSNAVTVLLGAYAAAENAVHGTVDLMFSNPESNIPYPLISSPDSNLNARVVDQRIAVRKPLARQAVLSVSLSTSADVKAELTQTEVELREVRTFLDSVVALLNKGLSNPTYSQTEITGLAATVVGARTSLTAAISAVGVAKENFDAKTTALAIAQKNLEQGVVGGQAEDVASAKAALKQAQGVLAAARANLEKAIIRAPIAGTINSFSLKRGDYVQISTPVLTVANNNTLEVLAYVSDIDARELAVGQKASVDSATGVVTRVAPALDPITKKIEVRVGLDGVHGLTNGQSVLVSIERVQRNTGADARITIPLSAIKVETERTIVFTVMNSLLITHPVIIGTLLGDRVVVLSGLTPDMRIVVDARGLQEGEKVEVSTQSGSSSGGK